MVKQRKVWVRNYPDGDRIKIKNKICPNCNKKNKRIAICCCKDCSEEYFKDKSAVLDWKETRKQAFKRDDYTCADCGVRFESDSELIGDHISPIACGGAEFDLDNIQTLCWDCNKIKTKADMKVIAKYRKCEKLGIEYVEQVKLLN